MVHISPGALFFYLLASVVLVSAAGVALARNILYSAFALLGTLAGVAGLYLYLGADFLGIAQLLIYVGGILVLILFAVLLTNRIGELRITNVSAGLMVGAPTAIAVMALIVKVALTTPWPTTEAVAYPTTARLGEAFLREYLMPFELLSLVLLMALVGAMVIARRAAKEPGRRR
jgi:NADH-quinone oxidoreductase subunit J